MIHAYDRIYLQQAQSSFGTMLDYAVHDLGMPLDSYYRKFIDSDIANQFAKGNCSYIAGRSGIELALDVLETNPPKSCYRPTANRSQEYWTGWALSYYQWLTGLSFRQIDESIPITEIRGFYHPYHEMDISQFCDAMQIMYRDRNTTSRIKRQRIEMGLSQRQLADQTGIPIRTIQQYEQRQKNINVAGAETVLKISRFLHCQPEDLLEL